MQSVDKNRHGLSRHPTRNFLTHIALIPRANNVANIASDITDCTMHKTFAHGVNTVAAESDLGVLIITHYQRILHMVQPDRVSIMYDGRIVKQGDSELVEQLEREGYGWVREEATAA